MSFDWNILSPEKMKESYILLKNRNKAYISSYENMHIDYITRKYAVENENTIRETTDAAIR